MLSPMPRPFRYATASHHDMTSDAAPPLPTREAALLTYSRAVGFLLPTLFIWVFNSKFLLPKVKSLWANSDLPGSSAQWIVDSAVFLTEYMDIVILAVGVPFLAAELFWRKWPRFRGVAVAMLTVCINATVLFGVTAISTTIMVALPITGKAK